MQFRCFLKSFKATNPFVMFLLQIKFVVVVVAVVTYFLFFGVVVIVLLLLFYDMSPLSPDSLQFSPELKY